MNLSTSYLNGIVLPSNLFIRVESVVDGKLSFSYYLTAQTNSVIYKNIKNWQLIAKRPLTLRDNNDRYILRRLSDEDFDLVNCYLDNFVANESLENNREVLDNFWKYKAIDIVYETID